MILHKLYSNLQIEMLYKFKIFRKQLPEPKKGRTYHNIVSKIVHNKITISDTNISYKQKASIREWEHPYRRQII